jgi:hypothetical protein
LDDVNNLFLFSMSCVSLPENKMDDENFHQILDSLTQMNKKQLKVLEIECRDLKQELKLKEESDRINQEIEKAVKYWRNLTNDLPLHQTYDKLENYQRWIFARIEFVNNDDIGGEEHEIRCDYDNCKWIKSGGYDGGSYDGTGFVWFLDSSYVICHVCYNRCLSKIEKILRPEMIRLSEKFIDSDTGFNN